MKSQLLTAGVLATTAVVAQDISGEFGRQMMYGQMGGGGFFWMLIGTALFLGLTVLVWLWVVKLWRELRQKHK